MSEDTAESTATTENKTEEGASTAANDDVFSLYILKSNKQSLSQAETFLRNRGWQIGAGVNLREALAYIIQKQPQYVMITSDHPNKKVKMLPKLLTQAFPVKVIGFAEKQSGPSIRVLNEMALEYNLYPPVSGPAIDRLCRKIKLDAEKKAAAGGDTKLSANHDPKAQGDAGAPGIGGTKSSFDQARAALTQLISQDAEPGEDSGGSMFQPGEVTEQKKGPAYWGGEGSGSKPGGAAYTPNHQASGAAYMPNHQQGEGHHGGSAYMPPEMQKQDNESFDQWAERMKNMAQNSPASLGEDGASGNPNAYLPPEMQKQDNESFDQWADRMKTTAQKNPAIFEQAPAKHSGPLMPPEMQMREDESFDQWAERMRQAALNNPAAFENPDAPGNSFLPPDLQKKEGETAEQWAERMKQAALRNPTAFGSGDMSAEGQGPRASADDAAGGKGPDSPVVEAPYIPPKRKKSPRYGFGSPKPPLDDPNQSIIVRGSQQALDDSVTVVDEDVEGNIVEKTSNVACITVESPRFSGYLVCALGKDRKIDKTLIDAVQKKLFAFLRNNGEELRNDDTMNMKLQEVDFEDWSLQQAEFLRKSIHEGDEIAMAFFPTKDTQANLEDSASEKMVKMSLDDLKPDTAVEFDMYVYMPENNKYLLYTPEGQVFYGDQQKRLKEKGVGHMHLRKDSVHSVKKYKAQNFLNEKIAAYNQAKQIKETKS